MEFWAATEAHQPAYIEVTAARKVVEPFLNAAFRASTLAQLQAKLRYVPIVMPKEMHERYPKRSRLRKKEGIYDCAPILDYEAFVSGTWEDQLKEYIRGIALSAPYLAGLGATQTQIADFESIPAGAVERILVERPDQSRHEDKGRVAAPLPVSG